MKRIILFFSLSMTLAAAQIQWYGDYAKAYAQAHESHKPLMLFLTREGCKSCAYMREHVFTDKAVQDYVSAHYIAAELPNGDSSVPAPYRIKVAPVFTFIDTGEDEIVEQIIGGKKAAAFLELLESIIDDNPQFH